MIKASFARIEKVGMPGADVGLRCLGSGYDRVVQAVGAAPGAMNTGRALGSTNHSPSSLYPMGEPPNITEWNVTSAIVTATPIATAVHGISPRDHFTRRSISARPGKKEVAARNSR